MNGERLLVWAVAVAAACVFSLAVIAPPTVPAQLLVAALGTVIVVPLAYVTLQWLYSYRTTRRGWR